MISCSHWGMFEAAERMLVLPKGFKLPDGAAEEWAKPDGFIQLVPVEIRQESSFRSLMRAFRRGYLRGYNRSRNG